MLLFLNLFFFDAFLSTATSVSPTTSVPPATAASLNCGRPKRSRIVGGEIASNRDWPWQVGIQSLDDDFIFCGGSLLDREWVLTAAHCIVRNNPSRRGCVAPNPGLRVVLGEFDVENIDGHEVKRSELISLLFTPSNVKHKTLKMFVVYSALFI